MTSCHKHVGLYCIIPPYVVDHMASSSDADIRKAALEIAKSASAARASRSLLATMPAMAAIPSLAATKERYVYDLQGRRFGLPGKLVRREGMGPSGDEAVDEAYQGSGIVYDFYKEQFHRNSLDNRGMALISSVHYGRNHNNAAWNGEQMFYGDGDGRAFIRFTAALDVIGHELTHGVVTHTCNLDYEFESGALNEHFADVFGTLVRQNKNGESVRAADWHLGKDILGANVDRATLGLRTFTDAKAFDNDPVLGSDPQPKHLRDKFEGLEDRGGVHINSGIPNHAFYLLANELGGNAWEAAGHIWYETMQLLRPTSQFAEMVARSEQAAQQLCGAGSTQVKAVQSAWKAVGF